MLKVNISLYSAAFYPRKERCIAIWWLCSVTVPSFSMHSVCVSVTYCSQVGSWIGFTVMTQCVPVAFFTLVAFIQMTVWAKGKHRSYLKEFRDYPTLRSSILPFIL